MKYLYFLKTCIILSFCLLTSFTAFAQPMGANLAKAIDAGNLNSPFTDTRNNAPANGYGNDMGQPSDDIYYKFTLKLGALVSISHCTSGFDTYMYVLNSNGVVIASNDDNGPLCTGSVRASIQIQLAAGTYYVVSEGYSTYSGDIITQISRPTPSGATQYNAINAGTLIPGLPFSDTKNNAPANNFGNDMGQPSDDIYYQFTLNNADLVSISHCASSFDTYIYLLDAEGAIIASNDDNGPLCASFQASLKKQLAAGTYWVVSEGYGANSGNITTQISIPAGTKEIDNTFSQQITQIFAQLETSRVPYGLLRDIALEQTNLDNYKGTILADSNYVNNEEFRAIYQTLISARIQANAPAFTPIETIDNFSYSQRQPGKIILTGLYYKYSRFTDNAVASNQISIVNNQVYDKYISGVWQNPYQVENAFAITAATDTYTGKNQQLIFPPSLWLSNDAAAVSNMQVDAGDGLGYRALNINQQLPVNYPDTGLKVITYKLNLNNNTTLYSHSQIHILPSVLDIYPNTEIIPIVATEAFNGQFAQGTMLIQYANPALGLQHPLIVAEGFDPGRLLNPELPYGDTKIDNFLDDTQDNNDLQNILIDNPQFDIVYVDWRNGTDDIKKNALLLKEVIREVNKRKALAGSTDKNVVMGISMGGLVARWALKDMENKNELHQTSLYISDDSPHQGANVPLGYQFLAKHFSNLYLKTGPTAVLAQATSVLSGSGSPYSKINISDEPASRQMLINYVNSSYQVDNSLHDQWQNELKAMGYPAGDPGSPIRKIAISNAAQCGTGQGIVPNDLLLNFTGKANTRLLGDLTGMMALPFIGIFLNQPGLILGVLPGRNDWKFDIQLNATNTGGGNQVYHNKITYTKKILWIIPITVNITNKTFNAPAGMLPYDSFAGGYMDVMFDLSNATCTNWFYKYNITASNKRLFGFIPAVSSLDIGYGNASLTAADYQAKYLASSPPAAPKNTPFQNFITANTDSRANESHTTITELNGNWLAAELQNTNAVSTDCTFLCTNSISGPGNMCSAATYSINNLPAGATVVWSVTGALSIVGSNTGNSVVLSPNGYGPGVLNAFTTSVCGNMKVVTTNITVGITMLNITAVKTSPAGTPTNYKYTAPLISGATYNWYVDNVLNQTTLSNTFNWYFPCNTTRMIKVQVVNVCGTPIYSNSVSNTGECKNMPYVISPNPSNSSIKISTISTDDTGMPITSTGQAQRRFSYKLYTDKGKILREGENDGKEEVVIDIKDIPNGTYFIHITEGEEVIKKQVIIQH